MRTALRTPLEQLQNHFASGWKPRALQHPPAGRILPRQKCGGLQAGPEPAGCYGLRSTRTAQTGLWPARNIAAPGSAPFLFLEGVLSKH